MSIADRLAKSVRQAKEASTGGEPVEGSDLDLKSTPESKPAANAPERLPRAGRGKKAESDDPITPFPSRRVWPD